MASTRGYVSRYGYWGWVPWEDKYMLFDSEEEYMDYLHEHGLFDD
jgi:hypothetical protein